LLVVYAGNKSTIDICSVLFGYCLSLCKWQEVFAIPTRVLCYGAQPPKRLTEITKCRNPVFSSKHSTRLSGQRPRWCSSTVGKAFSFSF